MTRTPEDPAGDAVQESPGGAGADPTGGATGGPGADAARPRSGPLTDERLRAELDRRGRGRGGAVPTDRIAAAVHDWIAVLPQEPRWRLSLRAWAPRIGVATTAVAALLVVALAGLALLTDIQRADIQHGGPGTHWDPAERPLTADELGRLFPPDGSSPFAGDVVLADVGLVGVMVDCVDVACDVAIDGIDPEILVHYDPARTVPAPTTDVTFAFRVREDRGLDLIERVRPAPLRLAWSVSDLADEMRRVSQFDRAVPTVYLVDAWLVGLSPPPPCPAPFPLDSPPPPGLDVGCGVAAWLTPLEEQPTTGGPNSIEVAVPRDGLRVQNGAYDKFAPDPVRGPNLSGIETRRRGLYLVRPNPTSVDACFMCTPLGGPVEIVARVDPLTIPAGPSATVVPAATASPAASPGTTVGLSFEGLVEQGCASEGGCAYFVRLEPGGGDSTPDAPWLRFDQTLNGLGAPAEAPVGVAPGAYRISARVNWVSDVIFNNGPPSVGGVVASCQEDVAIDPTLGRIVLRVTFHGDRPCEIEAVAAPSPAPSAPSRTEAPTPATAGSASVPVTITIDDPGWNRLANPKFAVTTCHGASDCGHVDEIYPGIDFSGMDVDFSQAFVLRVVGGVPISAAWEGRTLTITVRARTGGFAQATIGSRLYREPPVSGGAGMWMLEVRDTDGHQLLGQARIAN